MNVVNSIIALLIIIPVTLSINRDFNKGLRISILLLVSLPSAIMIELPGDFFNLPIQRLIIIVLFIAWLRAGNHKLLISKVPFIRIISVLCFINFISLIFSIDTSASLKEFFSFILEGIIPYIIFATIIVNKKDALKILPYIIIGLSVVAILATVEKYTGFNPVNYIPGFYRISLRGDMSRDVISTYPHRILLGVAMAMGWSLALALDDYEIHKIKRKMLWLAIFLMVSSCYFANSRGPWLAFMLSTCLVFCFSSYQIKKKILFVVMLIICVLMIRPGVLESLKDKYNATRDPNSLKGSSYEYRWALWEIAYSKLIKSSDRMLWGYGPGTHHSMDLSAQRTYGNETWHINEYWSWDNHYACILLETGFVGLTITILLHLLVLKRAYQGLHQGGCVYRNIMVAIFSSILVYFFMMTNVYIFSKQLIVLQWSLIAMSTAMQRENDSD